jgi:hypothetical protein
MARFGPADRVLERPVLAPSGRPGISARCPLIGGEAEPPKTIPDRLPPLGPPKRLFEFVRDVAPGDADIVQVALGPACELPTIAITLPPEMKGLRRT